MKSNKMAKKVAASVLTGSMVFSMGGMTAFAADPITSIPFQKVVTTDGNTYAPATTFKFDIKEGASGTFDNKSVEAGVPGGLKVENEAAFNFTPNSDSVLSDRYSKTGALVTDPSVFNAPGIYHYTIEEIDDAYNGIEYDEDIHDVYVYVMRNSADNELYVDGVIVPGEDGKASDLIFTNDYGKENDDDVREITITKTISGNQSDYDDGFTFTVTVNGDANEMFKGVITRHGNSKESAGEDPDVLTFVSDASLSNITLYGGDVLTIYGLSSNDTYTVIEDRTTSVNQGYNDTTVKVGSGDATSGYEATDVQYDTNVVFNNDKTVSTPTGIAMTFAPYALMVVAAGGFAALFLRKKREDF